MVVVGERLADVSRGVVHGAGVVAHEVAGLAVDADALGRVGGEVVLDGLEQVGLAQAAPAVDEQGVVAVAAVGDRLGRLEGELVLLALDEGVEGEARVLCRDLLDEGVGLAARRLGALLQRRALCWRGGCRAHPLELGGRDGGRGGRVGGRGGCRLLAAELDFEVHGLEGRAPDGLGDERAVLLDAALDEGAARGDDEGVLGEVGGRAAPQHGEGRRRQAVVLEHADDVIPEDLGVRFLVVDFFHLGLLAIYLRIYCFWLVMLKTHYTVARRGFGPAVENSVVV